MKLSQILKFVFIKLIKLNILLTGVSMDDIVSKDIFHAKKYDILLYWIKFLTLFVFRIAKNVLYPEILLRNLTVIAWVQVVVGLINFTGICAHKLIASICGGERREIEQWKAVMEQARNYVEYRRAEKSYLKIMNKHKQDLSIEVSMD